jgi:hypothetical protein
MAQMLRQTTVLVAVEGHQPLVAMVRQPLAGRVGQDQYHQFQVRL